MNEQLIESLEKKLNYTFKNKKLLETALTHSSYANENKKNGTSSNERLEFLGDSVLGMTIATMIYKMKTELPEGRMTRLRSELVCEKSLALMADTLGIGEYLMLGYGEDKNGGRERPSILADAVEAILAAMYLDGGIKTVEKLVSTYFGKGAMLLNYENSDFKTSLQEVIQEKPGQTLSYHVVDESGPDHMKSYTVEVRLNGNVIGRGKGKSKKDAEQSAARMGLTEISR